MTWSSRRQLTILGIIFTIVALGLYFLIAPYFKSVPNCFDGKKNSDEFNIDCGGNCQNYCLGQLPDPEVKWVKLSTVSLGNYNAWAYIENKNLNAVIKQIGYEFSLYDEDNKFIAKKNGSTFISFGGITPIFEININTGRRLAEKASFKFTEEAKWIKYKKPKDLFILTGNKSLKTDNGVSELSASITNKSPYRIVETDIVAIIYNRTNEPIVISKTSENINQGEEKKIFFTWPGLFEEETGLIEIIPIINPFLVKY